MSVFTDTCISLGATALYDFSEAAGGEVPDRSGNLRGPLQLGPAVTLEPSSALAAFPKVGWFSAGEGAHAHVPWASWMDLGQSFTWVVVGRVGTSQNSSQNSFANLVSHGNHRMFLRHIAGQAGRIAAEVRETITLTNWNTATAQLQAGDYSTLAWHTFAVQADAGTARAWVDGEVKRSSSQSVTIGGGPDTPLSVGARLNDDGVWDRRWRGHIGAVVGFPGVLSAADMLAIHEAADEEPEDDPTLAWRLWRTGVRRLARLVSVGDEAFTGTSRLFYSSSALTELRGRMDGSGPYYSQGDAGHGGQWSPGAGAYAESGAAAFLANPQESYWSQPDLPFGSFDPGPPHNTTHARPMLAAWCWATQPGRSDADQLRDAVKAYLLDHARDPSLDYSDPAKYPHTQHGAAQNPIFGVAEWLVGVFKARDLLHREVFTAGENQELDAWMYGYANWVFAWINWVHRNNAPNRLDRSYSTISSNWGNNDGRLPYDGGPPITFAALAYTNRHATTVMAASFAANYLRRHGVQPALVTEPSYGVSTVESLVDQSRLFVEEMLRFSVYPEGFQGDFERSSQDHHTNPPAWLGWSYSMNTCNSCLMIASFHARRGDMSVWNFQTTSGVGGSEGVPIEGGFAGKSLHFWVWAMVRYHPGSDWDWERVRYGQDLVLPAFVQDVYPAALASRLAPDDGLLAAAWRREGAGFPAYPQTEHDQGPWDGWQGQGGIMVGLIEDGAVGYTPVAPPPPPAPDPGDPGDPGDPDPGDGESWYTELAGVPTGSGLAPGWTIRDAGASPSVSVYDESRHQSWPAGLVRSNRVMGVSAADTATVMVSFDEVGTLSGDFDMTFAAWASAWVNRAAGISPFGSTNWYVSSLRRDSIRWRVGGNGSDVLLPAELDDDLPTYFRWQRSDGRMRISVGQDLAQIEGDGWTPSGGWLVDVLDPQSSASGRPCLYHREQNVMAYLDWAYVWKAGG